MKKEAGWFQKGRFEEGRRRLVVSGLYGGMACGLLIGIGMVPLFYAVSVLIGVLWAGLAWGGVVVIVLAIVRKFVGLVESDGSLVDNVKKGVDGERRVGGLLEGAITAEGCAVVHSVKEIARIGDIDHIVVTHKAVWVVETKYAAVPRDCFNDVLNTVAENMQAVREWASGDPVIRGCLVLAYEKSAVKRHREGNRKDKRIECVEVYASRDLDELAEKIRKEVGGRRSIHGKVVSDVLALNSSGE